MSSIPSPIPALSPLRIQRHPRAVVVLTVVLLFAGGGLMMHAESQIQVLGLLAAFLVMFAIADRTPLGQDVSAICSDYSGFANAVAFVCALGLIVVFHGEHYTLLMLATVALFSTACIALNLQLAFAGIANFAGAAFFVLGSYTAAVLTAYSGIPHLMILVVSGIVTGAIGVVLLLPVLRTRGHYAALVTIAFGLLLRSLLEVNDTLGGPQGMKIKGFSIFGLDFNRVSSIGPWDVSFYLPYAVLSICIFAVAFTLIRRLERSWIGIALDTVRSDETAASVFGLSIARWKVVAFLIGNAVIGVAGAVYGMMNGFVTPNGSGLGDSLLMLSIIVLGGLGDFWGAVVAAMVILVVPEKLQAIQEFRLLIFALLVLGILLFRRRAFCRGRSAICRASSGGRERRMNAPLLACGGLTMRFDELVALDSLDIEVGKGETVGLVGPNGSGKTTFFNVVTGLYKPSAGSVRLDARDLFAKPPQMIGRAGVARTFQRSRLMLDQSVFDNIVVGALCRLDLGLFTNLFRRRRWRDELSGMVDHARALAHRFNPVIADRLFQPAGSFTMIDRRRIEICRALIGTPRLLLLDEPSAGMTHDETRQLMDDLLAFRQEMPDLAVILVEHEMDVIRRVSDRCVVLNFGRKIFEGSFDALIANSDVQTAYLGVSQ